MKVRFEDRILARKLRTQGASFSEIIEKIPNLSKGTLNGWLKDIELTATQKERLLIKIKLGGVKARFRGSLTNHKKRVEITKEIINSAKNEARKRITEHLFTAGIMLYWAEGDKTQERVGFTNADPLMIKFMMNWFRTVCKVSESRFRVALSIMALHDKGESERFWSKITGLPERSFNKTRIKPTLLKGKRNPSYMGTCRIIISDKNLFRRITGWKLGLLENFNKKASIA